MSLDYLEREQQNRFEYPILILLSTAGMLMLISAADLIALYLGLELMSLVALRRRRDQPRLRALDRGRPEVFRARRAVVGHAALRRSLIYGFTGTVSFAGIAKASAQGRHRPDLRPGVPVRRLLLQGLGGAVPHVDAGRLRGRADAGHRVLRGGAEGRRHGDVRARRHRRVPRHRAAVAADRGVRRRSPRWCSARSPPSASATSSG